MSSGDRGQETGDRRQGNEIRIGKRYVDAADVCGNGGGGAAAVGGGVRGGGRAGGGCGRGFCGRCPRCKRAVGNHVVSRSYARREAIAEPGGSAGTADFERR